MEEGQTGSSWGDCGTGWVVVFAFATSVGYVFQGQVCVASRQLVDYGL